MFGVGQCKTFQVMTRTKNKKKFVIFDDGLTVAEEDSRTATKKNRRFSEAVAVAEAWRDTPENYTAVAQ